MLKKITAILLSAALCMSGGIMCLAAEETSSDTFYADFETNTAGFDGDSSLCEISLVNGGGFDASDKALEIRSLAGRSGYICNYYSLKAGVTYKISYNIKASEENVNARAYAVTAGDWTNNTTWSYSTVGTQWKTVSFNHTVLESHADASTQLTIGLNDGTIGKTIYVDDVSIAPVEETNNLITNGNFDNDMGVSSWETANVTVTHDAADGVLDLGCAVIASTAADDCFWSNAMALDTNKTYKLEYYVKPVKNAANTNYFQTIYALKDGSGGWSINPNYVYTALKNDAGWQKVTSYFTTTFASTQIMIKCLNTGSEYKLDNVKVTECPTILNNANFGTFNMFVRDGGVIADTTGYSGLNASDCFVPPHSAAQLENLSGDSSFGYMSIKKGMTNSVSGLIMNINSDKYDVTKKYRLSFIAKCESSDDDVKALNFKNNEIPMNIFNSVDPWGMITDQKKLPADGKWHWFDVIIEPGKITEGATAVFIGPAYGYTQDYQGNTITQEMLSKLKIGFDAFELAEIDDKDAVRATIDGDFVVGETVNVNAYAINGNAETIDYKIIRTSANGYTVAKTGTVENGKTSYELTNADRNVTLSCELTARDANGKILDRTSVMFDKVNAAKPAVFEAGIDPDEGVAYVMLTNNKTPKNICVFAAMYNGDKLIDTKIIYNGRLEAYQEIGTTDAYEVEIDLSNATSAKCFVWDGTSTAKPYEAAIENWEAE